MKEAGDLVIEENKVDLQGPLAIGIEIGHPAGTRGTLGAFVTFMDAPGEVGILSSAGAIAPLQAKQGDWIHRIAANPEAIMTGYTRIGRLRAFSKLEPNSHGVLDAAVAMLETDISTAGNRIAAADPLGAVLPARELEVGTEVAMLGAFSKMRLGVVTAPLVENVSAMAFGKPVSLAPTTEIVAKTGGPFSMAGDAGALVYRVADRRPIGLVSARRVANGEPATYAVNLSLILERLQLELLNG
jgi:hypothetical protein